MLSNLIVYLIHTPITHDLLDLVLFVVMLNHGKTSFPKRHEPLLDALDVIIDSATAFPKNVRS